MSGRDVPTFTVIVFRYEIRLLRGQRNIELAGNGVVWIAARRARRVASIKSRANVTDSLTVLSLSTLLLFSLIFYLIVYSLFCSLNLRRIHATRVKFKDRIISTKDQSLSTKLFESHRIASIYIFFPSKSSRNLFNYQSRKALVSSSERSTLLFEERLVARLNKKINVCAFQARSLNAVLFKFSPRYIQRVNYSAAGVLLITLRRSWPAYKFTKR